MLRIRIHNLFVIDIMIYLVKIYLSYITFNDVLNKILLSVSFLDKEKRLFL